MQFASFGDGDGDQNAGDGDEVTGDGDKASGDGDDNDLHSRRTHHCCKESLPFHIC